MTKSLKTAVLVAIGMFVTWRCTWADETTGATTPPANTSPRAAEETELESLSGTWICVEAFKEGNRVDNFVGVRAVLDGTNMTWIFPRHDGKDFRQECKFVIDVDQNPRHFDWYAIDDPKKRKLRLYKIEDGMLYWATNISTSNRPNSFDDATWVFRCRKLKPRSARAR